MIPKQDLRNKNRRIYMPYPIPVTTFDVELIIALITEKIERIDMALNPSVVGARVVTSLEQSEQMEMLKEVRHNCNVLKKKLEHEYANMGVLRSEVERREANS